MASRALATLEATRLPEIRVLMEMRPAELERRNSDRVVAQNARGRAQALNRGSIVLLCAHVEGFLEDLVVEIVDALNGAPVPKERIPIALLAAHAYPEIEVIAAMTDADKRDGRVEDFFERQQPLWFAAAIEGGVLAASVLTAGMSNPGGPETKRLLRLVGLPDGLDAVALRDGSPVEARLNELVGVRNAVAHGVEVDVSDDQVERGFETLAVLGQALDAIAAAKVQAVLGTPVLPW